MTERFPGFLACLLALAALSFYSERVGSVQVDTIPEIVARQGLPNGQEVALTSDAKVVEIRADGFTAEQGGSRIGVRIPPQLSRDWQTTKQEITPGDYISLRGVYRAGGYLEARDYHVHKGRRLKIWVSVAALLAVTLLVGKQVREGKNA